MTLYYSDDSVTLHHGDVLDVLREAELEKLRAENAAMQTALDQLAEAGQP